MNFVIKNLEHTAKNLLSRIDGIKTQVENKEYIDDLQKIRMLTLVKKLRDDYNQTRQAIDVLGDVN